MSKLAMNHTFKLAFASALFAFPTLAQACRCAPPAPKIALEKSAAVFVGHVTSIQKGERFNTYQFAVSKQWKGMKSNTTSIVTATNSAACGINFDEDRDYLVYAYKTEGDDQLRTNLCSRTKRAVDAAVDLAELGAPMADAPTKTSTSFMPTGRDAIRNTVQLKADGDKQPLEVLAQALQSNKNARLLRVSWASKNSPAFYGTALYDRQNSTLKVYDHSHTLSMIPPQTVITSVLYSNVTPQIVQQLAENPQTARMLTGFLYLFGISPGIEKYGITAQDLGSKRIDD